MLSPPPLLLTRSPLALHPSLPSLTHVDNSPCAERWMGCSQTTGAALLVGLEHSSPHIPDLFFVLFCFVGADCCGGMMRNISGVIHLPVLPGMGQPSGSGDGPAPASTWVARWRQCCLQRLFCCQLAPQANTAGEATPPCGRCG